MLDRGLWISWYNLPQDGRDRYFSWLHESYIPRMLKQPRFLWAAHYKSAKIAPLPHIRHTSDPAVPKGADYILIFGAESAHAFSKGVDAFTKGAPSKLDANLTDEDRHMLGLRIGERIVITAEEDRIDGPEAGTRKGLISSPGIQLGSFNAQPQAVEDELLSWYADWRMEAMGKLPGCVGMRKLVSTSGWAKHLVLYEFTSLADRAKHLPSMRELYPAQMKWTEEWIPKLTHTPESPVVAERIWP